MRKTAAVLGSPISHSLSPLIHNHAYKKLGLDLEYIAAEVNESEFKKWIRSALSQSDQWFGFSLTMPLKEVVCDEELADLIYLDSEAKRINSANTLYMKEGKWAGVSTDVSGFEFLLKPHDFRKVKILGAGGTARAALSALNRYSKNRNLEIQVVRRNPDVDKKLSACMDDSKIEFVKWEELTFSADEDLVISTVPLQGAEDSEVSFTGAKLLLDALYSPWPPPMTAKQIKTQRKVISGLELLCAQAVDQIALMTGMKFSKEEMFKELLQVVQKSR